MGGNVRLFNEFEQGVGVIDGSAAAEGNVGVDGLFSDHQSEKFGIRYSAIVRGDTRRYSRPV